jgi:4-oxalocrotonate tautomerase
MPFVIVEMWEGRTPEQKKQLAKDITDAFVKNSIPAEAVQIILKDNPKNCWAQGGQMCSERK